MRSTPDASTVVHAVEKSIGIDYAFRGWEAVIKKTRLQLESNITAWSRLLLARKFYANVLEGLLAVKDAIRNPSMHGRINYDAERAEDVYRTSGAFMRK